MDCSEAVGLFYRYLDGELDISTREAVELHLEVCHSCRDQVRFERALKQVLREKLGTEEMPPELREKVLRLVEEAAEMEREAE